MTDHHFWQTIIDNGYVLPEDHSLVDLTLELMSYLGAPDSALRDTFGYNILARWIIIYGYYTPEEMRAMIEWLSPRMIETLGDYDSDTVFLRSYCALILSLIAYRDNQIGFLSQAETRTLLDKARHYLVTERDLRAYIPEKGWANSCAHTAELLKFLARSGQLDSADLLRLMDTIADKLTTDTQYIFNHDEDERLAQVVMSVLRRDSLNMFELTAWVNRFKDWKQGQVKLNDDFNPSYHAIYQNIKNFLRSLYCQMQLAASIPIEAQDFEIELREILRIFSL